MKKTAALILSLVLLLTLCVPALAADVVRTSQKLTVDGSYVNCDIYNIDGSNYFKLRDLAYLMNGTASQFAVGYDAATQTVTVTTGEAYVPNGSELVIGPDKSDTAVVSAQTVLIDGEADSSLSVYNIGGNNFFKLRDLGAAVGFGVDYNAATSTMIVTSSGNTAGGSENPSGGSETPAELTAEQIYAKCVPAVFLIEVYDSYGDPLGTGSGFFIDKNGTAVTNFHVIYGGTYAEVTVTDVYGQTGTFDVLGVYDYNEEEDWAILKVDGSDFSFLQFGSPETVVGGATVYALGSPLGFADTLSQGLISNPARTYEGQTYIQTNAAISPGSSGGALINKYGEVIGITCAEFLNGQNLNLAVPVTKLANIKTDGTVPINETYVMPTGVLYPELYYVSMGLNSFVCDIITAIEYDCDEVVTVEFEVEDSSLLECEWGEWSDDQTEIPLYIYSGAETGSTTVWLYFYTESDTMLNYSYINVDITGGYLELDQYYMGIDQGDVGVLNIWAGADSGASVYLHADVDDPDIASLSFGPWDGDEIQLYITANACGSTGISIDLIETDTGRVLNSESLWLEVYGGTLSITPEYLEMDKGDTRTVTITGIPFDSTVNATISCECYDDSVVSWDLGPQEGGTAVLTVTAKEDGWEYIYVSLVDENGVELNYGWIDVSVGE